MTPARVTAAALAALCLLGTSASVAGPARPARPDAPCPPCSSSASATTRCLDGREKLEVAPWGASLELSVGVGLFFVTHANVRLGIGRRFWDRLELEAAVQLIAGEQLVGVAGSLRAGILLHLSRRWELLMGWRLGYAGFQINLPVDQVRTGSLQTSVILEAKCFLARSLELRLAPVVATGYWNQLWGFVVEPTLGLAYRF